MDIIHDKSSHHFYVEMEGERAYLEYALQNGELNILHTVVPSAIGGRGVAGALVSAAYDYARSECLCFVPTCSYAKAWLERYLWTHGGM